MKFQVKQALHIMGKDFPTGLRDFSEAHMNHAHFKLFEKAGYIVEPDSDKAVPIAETVQERAARLDAKFNAPKAAAVDPEPSGEDLLAVDESESTDSDEKEDSKQTKKRRK